MAYLINDQTGETVEIPEGESTVGRGPLLKVGFAVIYGFAGVMAAKVLQTSLTPFYKFSYLAKSL